MTGSDDAADNAGSESATDPAGTPGFDASAPDDSASESMPSPGGTDGAADSSSAGQNGIPGDTLNPDGPNNPGVTDGADNFDDEAGSGAAGSDAADGTAGSDATDDEGGSDEAAGPGSGSESGPESAPGFGAPGSDAVGDVVGSGGATGSDAMDGSGAAGSGSAEAPDSSTAQNPALEGALGWEERDGATYYLDENGKPVTGLVRIDGAWYYLDPECGGARATGEITLPNGTYHFDALTGAMLEAGGLPGSAADAEGAGKDADASTTDKDAPADGKATQDAAANVLSGAAAPTGAPGWFTDATTNQTYYYDESGQKVTGERAIDGAWYYFDATTGAMAKGFADITTSAGVSKTVYYDTWGRMLYGELNANNAWYYFDRFNGTMARGITDIITNGGTAKTAYYASGGANDGQMQYGEYAINDHWYYFDDFNGAMARGITDIPTSDGGSKTVYYGDDGAMRYGEQAVNGGWYFFNTFDGRMTTGWAYLADAPKWVYYGADGRMRYGEQWIDGDHYWFDTFNGASDYAQVLRWRLNHASGSGNLSLFGGAQASSASMTQLAQAMGAFTGQGLNVGFVMMDIATGKGISANADQSFYSASTVKGPYVASLYDKVFGGSAGGWYQTLNDACVWSDNDAYYALRNAFGSSVFANWLYESGVDPNKANTNYTWFTPRELGKLWLHMYDYFGSGAGGDQMSGLFSHGYYSSIYNELGDQYEVRSKPGWYPYDPGYTATNDAGVVYAGGSPYLVVVLSDAPVRLDLVQSLVSALDSVHGSMVN